MFLFALASWIAPDTLTVLGADGKPVSNRAVMVAYPGARTKEDIQFGSLDRNGKIRLNRPGAGASVTVDFGHAVSLGLVASDGTAHLLPTVPSPRFKVEWPASIDAAKVRLFGSIIIQGADPLAGYLGFSANGDPRSFPVASDGAVALPDIPQGASVYLTATGPGLIPTYGGWNPGSPSPVSIKLQGAAQVSGRVMFEGKPVAGATVAAQGLVVDGSTRAETNGGRAVTDRNGEYTLSAPAGVFDLVMESAPDPALIAAPVKDVVLKLAVPISQANFALRRGTPFTITVRNSASGQPIQGVTLHANTDGNRRTQLTTNRQGRATLYLAPGRTYVVPVLHGTVQITNQPGVIVEISEGVPPKEIEVLIKPECLIAPMKVHGMVFDRGGHPVANAQVRLMGNGLPESVTKPMQTNAKGEFACSDLVPAGTRIYASLQGTAASSIQTVLQPELHLVLDQKPAALRGRVESEGKPLPGVQLSLYGRIDQTFAGHWQTTSLATGNYEFTDLPPGMDSFFLRARLDGFASETIQTIKLDAGQPKTNPTIELVPADGTVSGTVVDEKGKPVFHVEVSGQQDTAGSAQFTDQEGRFSLTRLKRGEFLVVATKGDRSGSLVTKTGQKDIVVKLNPPAAPERVGSIVNQDTAGMKARELDVAEWAQGEPAHVLAMKGRYVLLDFFHTGCAPCLASMPDIQKLQDEFSSQLTVIGVCDPLDAKPKLGRILKAKGVRYPVAIDKADKDGFPLTHQLYGYRGNPNLVLIDPQGTVVLTTSDFNEVASAVRKRLMP